MWVIDDAVLVLKKNMQEYVYKWCTPNDVPRDELMVEHSKTAWVIDDDKLV